MKQCPSCGGMSHRTKRCPYGIGVKSTKQLTRELVLACDALLMFQSSTVGNKERLDTVRNLCVRLRNNHLFID